MKRSERQTLANETVEIIRRGRYALPDGRAVHIAPQVEACLAATKYIPPNEVERLHLGPSPGHPTLIDVRNETTLQGIARLTREGHARVAALNFASAKNPGGGFLNGSQAQEESLARSSALYASLLRAGEFYRRHRESSSCLYSNAMILSPDCPVFRDDEGALLETPYSATFLTCPAPNAGAVSPSERRQIPDVLLRRAEGVLGVAAENGLEMLVLGAWGCGVFRNDPEMVAGTFAALLKGEWSGRFRRVAFSVLDTSADAATLKAFERAFA